VIVTAFDRPTGKLKVSEFGFAFDASGSAWGDGNGPAYGTDCQIAPGHYKLTRVEYFPEPIPSEGAAQIYVEDLTEADVAELVAAGDAKLGEYEAVTINGETLPIGNLAKYARSEIMIHGGGSNLGVPACYALNQPLCRTYGCTRVHNGDLSSLCEKLAPLVGSEHVIFTVVGDSPTLAR
jgi:hypothetical protein